jgi:hypothetical protein
MGSPDFLHTHAETPHCEHYTVAGAICSLATNSEQLFEAARGSFLSAEKPLGPVDLALRFWVDDADDTQPPWPKPYIRGLDHLVFVGLDARSSMLADLRTRRVIGRISPALAGDSRYWRTIIFPMLVSVVAGSIEVVELHASCVARGQEGLVLIGPSRSGKSTLAMALIESGFRLLSDDRTFLSVKDEQLRAFGLSRPLKLREDAASWFEELCDREPTDLQGGESVYYCEPNHRSRSEALRPCEPRMVVFLERQERSIVRMTPMDPAEAQRRIEADVMAETSDAMAAQQRALDALLALPCWHLQYGGGQPQKIAEQILNSFYRQAGTAFGA